MEEREAEESEYDSGKDSRVDQPPKKKRSHYGLFLQVERSDMKAAHTVLYMKKHTQTYASYPAMDISCMSVV